jgi:hypothetical protein
MNGKRPRLSDQSDEDDWHETPAKIPRIADATTDTDETDDEATEHYREEKEDLHGEQDTPRLSFLEKNYERLGNDLQWVLLTKMDRKSRINIFSTNRFFRQYIRQVVEYSRVERPVMEAAIQMLIENRAERKYSSGFSGPGKAISKLMAKKLETMIRNGGTLFRDPALFNNIRQRFGNLTGESMLEIAESSGLVLAELDPRVFQCPLRTKSSLVGQMDRLNPAEISGRLQTVMNPEQMQHFELGLVRKLLHLSLQQARLRVDAPTLLDMTVFVTILMDNFQTYYKGLCAKHQNILLKQYLLLLPNP